MNHRPTRQLRLGCGEALNSSMNPWEESTTRDQPPPTPAADVTDDRLEVDLAEPVE